MTDELNRVVSEANQLLDCAGLEIGDGSILHTFEGFYSLSNSMRSHVITRSV